MLDDHFHMDPVDTLLFFLFFQSFWQLEVNVVFFYFFSFKCATIYLGVASVMHLNVYVS